MQFNQVLAISGQPGLYTFKAQSQRGIIVEAIADQRRFSIPSTSRVSALNEISVFTQSEDLPLSGLFTMIHDHYKGAQAISHKESNEKIKEAFATVLPSYDEDRVHTSDMKKIFAWYNILNAAGVTSYTSEQETEDEAETVTTATSEE